MECEQMIYTEYEVKCLMSGSISGWTDVFHILLKIIEGISSQNRSEIKQHFIKSYKSHFADTFNKQYHAMTEQEVNVALKSSGKSLFLLYRETESLMDEKLTPLMAHQIKSQMKKTCASYLYSQ